MPDARVQSDPFSRGQHHPGSTTIKKQLATAGLVRPVVALIVAGALAPYVFIALGVIGLAILERFGFSRPGGTPFGLQETIGMGVIIAILGWPISIGTALAAGLPSVYLARRLHLTSSWIFVAGGAAFGFGCTAWLAHGDEVLSQRLTEWGQFAAVAALTGAFLGLLYWRIAERPLGGRE